MKKKIFFLYGCLLAKSTISFVSTVKLYHNARVTYLCSHRFLCILCILYGYIERLYTIIPRTVSRIQNLNKLGVGTVCCSVVRCWMLITIFVRFWCEKFIYLFFSSYSSSSSSSFSSAYTSSTCSSSSSSVVIVVFCFFIITQWLDEMRVSYLAFVGLVELYIEREKGNIPTS